MELFVHVVICVTTNCFGLLTANIIADVALTDVDYNIYLNAVFFEIRRERSNGKLTAKSFAVAGERAVYLLGVKKRVSDTHTYTKVSREP